MSSYLTSKAAWARVDPMKAFSKYTDGTFSSEPAEQRPKKKFFVDETDSHHRDVIPRTDMTFISMPSNIDQKPLNYVYLVENGVLELKHRQSCRATGDHGMLLEHLVPTTRLDEQMTGPLIFSLEKTEPRTENQNLGVQNWISTNTDEYGKFLVVGEKWQFLNKEVIIDKSLLRLNFSVSDPLVRESFFFIFSSKCVFE